MSNIHDVAIRLAAEDPRVPRMGALQLSHVASPNAVTTGYAGDALQADDEIAVSAARASKAKKARERKKKRDLHRAAEEVPQRKGVLKDQDVTWEAGIKEFWAMAAASRQRGKSIRQLCAVQAGRIVEYGDNAMPPVLLAICDADKRDKPADNYADVVVKPNGPLTPDSLVKRCSEEHYSWLMLGYQDPPFQTVQEALEAVEIMLCSEILTLKEVTDKGLSVLTIAIDEKWLQPPLRLCGPSQNVHNEDVTPMSSCADSSSSAGSYDLVLG